MSTADILRALAPHAILVGSAAHGWADYGDVDLVVGARGFRLAAKMLPEPRRSLFFGHWKTTGTEPAIEVMRYWFGPDYQALKRRAGLVDRTICGVTFRAWLGETTGMDGRWQPQE